MLDKGLFGGSVINTRRFWTVQYRYLHPEKPQCRILQASFLPNHSRRAANVLHSVSKGPKFERIDKDNVVLLVVDHQVGLFQMTHDMQPDLFKNNVIAHAAIGNVFNLPTILTTSAETGWPLLPSISYI
jgi:hypothetical protein